MKSFLFGLGLLGASPLLAVVTSLGQPVQAQCVVTDVAVQVAVHGSRQRAQQSNEVEVEQPGRCQGNTSTSVGTQVHVGGTGSVQQERRSRHRLQSREPRSGEPSGSTIVVPVEVQVDVDNAADRVRYEGRR
ncbi:MAG: hypothetical protein F6J97_04200 [Leptolyngbya sp. SIO4C1]|nr:hypothetical protein [Leptolyngbya sp. SIO4C1]